MNKTDQLIAQIQEQADEIQRERKRNQVPKKNAPTLDKSLLITLSGCTFNVHKQTPNQLILCSNSEINFDKGVDEIRVISYIHGVYKEVTIADWNWRPVKWKKNKLFLKPIAPTLM
ncbi:TPA: hypothetical protein ACVO14_002364 [Vibrio alginolyticus]